MHAVPESKLPDKALKSGAITRTKMQRRRTANCSQNDHRPGSAPNRVGPAPSRSPEGATSGFRQLPGHGKCAAAYNTGMAACPGPAAGMPAPCHILARRKGDPAGRISARRRVLPGSFARLSGTITAHPTRTATGYTPASQPLGRRRGHSLRPRQCNREPRPQRAVRGMVARVVQRQPPPRRYVTEWASVNITPR